MEKVKKVSIVIPVFNEEENVPILYDKLKKVLDNLGIGYEIIFVDDGSTDRTREILEEIASKDKKVKVIEFARNFGQTSAMMAGMDFATGDVIITMDGDLQNDPEDIPRLLEKIEEGYDVVSGWRKNRKDAAISRKLPSKIANWLIGKITGVRIHDYGCTLKAYRSDVIKKVRLYGELHRFIPALASTVTSTSKIIEIPVKHHPRIYGKSKYGISRTFKVIVDLIFIWFLKKFMQKPIHFFGILGLILLLIGSVSFLYLLGLKLLGHSIGGRPLLIISVLFILSGLQMFTTGIISEILMRIYYESQNKTPYVVGRTVNVEEK
ncbi:Glycosyltransferase involved in cell wall bisynthesis [Desulfurobacterium pacificum]|uniref:Glycosyltransferase involved in cell wall bisynthesis n=1 Tax=Desulfurobacterium pacificum TaxID=240166 RepID=A0ABY1NF57_9BACT|nr:glycosyltransferase family 2 protein [Desulfurobacterium pacificum]SMP07362.1 Glycosyltransferase involved in cell wall bisynthesis [Desulfurobacterium pacificum]